MSRHARAIAVLAAGALAACAADSPVAPTASSGALAFATEPAPLFAGDTARISVELRGAAGLVQWTSSDTTVAIVESAASAGGSASASIVARRPGVARVRASIDGASSDVSVQVRPRIGGLSLFPRSSAVAPGDSRQLVALASRVAHSDTAAVIDSRTAAFAPLDASWSSSDVRVARVDSLGNISAVAAGSATITVTIDGVPATADVTVQPATAHHLVIDVDAMSGGDAVARAADHAAVRWSRVIASDLPSVRLDLAPGTCGIPGGAIHRTVDDVLVVVRVDSIDGPGGAVASAVPCLVRDDWTPTLSVITIDAADLPALTAANHLDDVVAHEMGHALGVGMLWLVRQVVQGWGTSDPQFIGTATRQAAFDAGALENAANAVPVENMGGAGTANEHWRAGAFGSELMTGWLSSAPAALSAVTVASLRDVGYEVDPTGAEAFVATGAPVHATIGGAGLTRTAAVPLREQVTPPRFRIAHDGRLRAAQ